MIDKDQKIFNNIGSKSFAVYNRVVAIANILKVEDAQPSEEQRSFLQAVADWFDPNTGDNLLQRCMERTLVADNFLSACRLLHEFGCTYDDITAKYKLINSLLFDPRAQAFSTLSNIVHKTNLDNPEEEKLRDLIRQALKDPITKNFNYGRDLLKPFDEQNERVIFRLRDIHFDISPEIGKKLSLLIDSLHLGITYDRLYYDCHPENHFLDTSTDYFKEIILFLTSTDMKGMKCIDQLLCHNPSDKYNFHILLNNIFKYFEQNDKMNWEIKFKYSTNFRQNYNAPAHEVKMYFLFAVAEYLIYHDAPLILESFITNVSKTMSFESQIILFEQIYKIKCEIKASPDAIAKIDDIILEFLKDEKTRRESELTQTWFNRCFSNKSTVINYDLAKIAIQFSNTKALKYFLDDGISPYFAVLTNRNPLRLNLSSNSESDKLLNQYGFFTFNNISILRTIVIITHYFFIKPYVIYYFLFVRGLICNIIAPFLCIYSGQFLNGFSGIFDDFSPLPYEIMKDALYMTWFWTQVTHLYSICWAEILYINWEPKKDEYLSLSHRAVVYETAAIMFCINISYNCINFISNLLFSTSARDTEEHNVDLPTI